VTPERVQSEARRELLRAFVNGALAAIAGSVALVLGRFAYGPRAASAVSAGRWFRAAALGELDPGKPFAALLAVPRQDGWSRTRTNEVVFLVWDGLFGVRALSATCTHLGCRVRWDEAADRFRCPCHGGAYSVEGRVLAGPPPRPLAELRARISETGDVEVRW
jgi:nitrite reductase/ring-hydroxylating ferredoxin subunit